jgi:hypothetical protein
MSRPQLATSVKIRILQSFALNLIKKNKQKNHSRAREEINKVLHLTED